MARGNGRAVGFACPYCGHTDQRLLNFVNDKDGMLIGYYFECYQCGADWLEHK